MTIKVGKKKNPMVSITIILISLITITSGMTKGFSKSSLKLNIDAIVSQATKQSSLQINIIAVNETRILNETNIIDNSSSEQLNPISLEAQKLNKSDSDGFLFCSQT